MDLVASVPAHLKFRHAGWTSAHPPATRRPREGARTYSVGGGGLFAALIANQDIGADRLVGAMSATLVHELLEGLVA